MIKIFKEIIKLITSAISLKNHKESCIASYYFIVISLIGICNYGEINSFRFVPDLGRLLNSFSFQINIKIPIDHGNIQKNHM